MPRFLVGFSRQVPHAAAMLTESLIARGAVRLWDDLWSVDTDVCPQDLPGYLATESAFSVPADSAGIHYMLGRATSPDARAHFAQVIAPKLILPDADGDTIARVLYCNDGRHAFARAIDRYRQRIASGDHVTDLCRLMLAHGSDKSLGWHSYTPFYTALFEDLPETPRAILEFGLGTNNEDVPSNMGRHGTPGASLRAWRDHFPDARIYGADIDERILFQEDRIETFFVDQLRPATFGPLFEAMPEVAFDVVIDDGLHTFEAARHTFAQSFHRVCPGGLYVIEDVLADSCDDYVRMMEVEGCDGCVVDIRHPTNRFDNRLVVVRRRAEHG